MDPQAQARTSPQRAALPSLAPHVRGSPDAYKSQIAHEPPRLTCVLVGGPRPHWIRCLGISAQPPRKQSPAAKTAAMLRKRRTPQDITLSRCVHGHTQGERQRSARREVRRGSRAWAAGVSKKDACASTTTDAHLVAPCSRGSDPRAPHPLTAMLSLACAWPVALSPWPLRLAL